MGNYRTAFLRPFTDWKKLLIGISLYVVPILSMITGVFASGYLLRCLRSALRQEFALPEWENWGKLFLEGVQVIAISLIYTIPLGVILIAAAGAALGAMFAQTTAQSIGAVFAALGWLAVIVLVITLAVLYLVPCGLVQLARTGKFSAAFSREVFRVATSSSYLYAWLLAAGISLLGGLLSAALSTLLSPTVILPFIVVAFFAFSIGIISMTLFGIGAGERQ